MADFMIPNYGYLWWNSLVKVLKCNFRQCTYNRFIKQASVCPLETNMVTECFYEFISDLSGKQFEILNCENLM